VLVQRDGEWPERDVSVKLNRAKDLEFSLPR